MKQKCLPAILDYHLCHFYGRSRLQLMLLDNQLHPWENSLQNWLVFELVFFCCSSQVFNLRDMASYFTSSFFQQNETPAKKTGTKRKVLFCVLIVCLSVEV